MPIRIPEALPARKVLEDENIFVMSEGRAFTQDIRPLEIAILNLMPKKAETETQLTRLLGNTPLQVNLTLLQVATHRSRNTSSEHMLSFYQNFEEVKTRNFDGLVITGAPVETLAFEEVEYWDELCCIMEWSKSHVHSTLHICWGAQAALYYHFGIPKIPLDKKLSGVFKHKVIYRNPILLRGFDDVFMVPHSRHTTIDIRDVRNVRELKILAAGDEAGIYAMQTQNGKQIFITGHSEYDRDTQKNEYIRDAAAGRNPELPVNYFPDDDISKLPLVTWRSSANLLFSNWLNYFVYQTTPYDLSSLSE